MTTNVELSQEDIDLIVDSINTKQDEYGYKWTKEEHQNAKDLIRRLLGEPEVNPYYWMDYYD